MRYAAHITLIFTLSLIALVLASTAHASEDEKTAASALHAFVAADADANTAENAKQVAPADKADAAAQADAADKATAAADAAIQALDENVAAAQKDVDLQSFACVVLTKVPPVLGEIAASDTGASDSDDYVLVAPAGIDSITYRSNLEGVKLLVQRGKGDHRIYTLKISREVDFFTISLQFLKGYTAPRDCRDPTTPLTPPPPCCTTGESATTATQIEIDCIEGVFLRELTAKVVGFVAESLEPAAILTKYNMLISTRLIAESGRSGFPTFVIDGYSIRDYFPQASRQQPSVGTPSYEGRSGWAFGGVHHFEIYSAPVSCSFYPSDSDGPLDYIDAGFEAPGPTDNGESAAASAKRKVRFGDVRASSERPGVSKLNWVDNGITLGRTKVYDVFSLRQKLSATATALAGIAGFNPASINSAVGNLQGVSSDISYFTAQATAGTTPSSVTTANAANNVLTTTTPQSNAATNTVTTTCPAGYVPSTTGTGGSAVTTCTIPAAGNGGTLTQTTTATPAGGSSTVNVANPATLQTVTTNPSITASVPTAPVSTAPSAPTNLGVGASDILTEQVQLNSQITTLQMALQGALSDQYLVKQGKVLGVRKQTTLGFDISLNHPERYKHAVAELRVWVYPAQDDDSLSVVNLLPAAKTYNVAKITSNQKAFGASVVIDAVNVGANGGKTKNRLYIAKDTDTVALQYDPNSNADLRSRWKYGAKLVGRSPQEHVLDVSRVIAAWQAISDACDDDPGPDLMPDGRKETSTGELPLIFGWQFRPVLGADYVQAGDRQVFAQLALPVGLGGQYTPLVFVQTRWREYDEKKQVVGAVYEGSCSVRRDPDPILVDSPLEIRHLDVNDMGGGVLKVSAQGRFYQQGFSVMSGPNTIGTLPMDGEHLQFFANAATLLQMDDLQLLAEDGRTIPLAMKSSREESCGIRDASMSAVPRPDGTSIVEARITSERSYNLAADKAPHPLFLVGTQVYGLHETPFLEPPRTACHSVAGAWGVDVGIRCTYHFIAPTSSLRSAENFTVRDLAWTRFKKSGTIELDPSFSSLANLATVKAATDTSTLTTASNAAPKATEKEVEVAYAAIAKADAAHAAAAKANFAKVAASYAAPAKKAASSSAGQAPPIYTLTGTDFERIRDWNCNDAGCLEVYQGLDQYPLGANNFRSLSKTTATIAFGPKTATPTCTADPAAGNSYSVKFKSTPGARITYILNGGPQQSFNSATVSVPAGATIQADALAEGYLWSMWGKWTLPSTDCPDSKASPGTNTATDAPQYEYASYRFVWHPYFGGPVVWDLSSPKSDTTTASAPQLLNQGDVTTVTFSDVDVWNDPSTMNFSFNDTPLTNPAPLFSYNATTKSLKFYVTSAMTSEPGNKTIVLNAMKGSDANDLSATQVLLQFYVAKK